MKSYFQLGILALVLAGCADSDSNQAMVQRMDGTQNPPTAKKMPEELTIHGDVRVDNYYWLNQRENPEVISYLEAENTYTQGVMAPLQPLQDVLFEELKGRVQEDQETLPYKYGDYHYYYRYVEGGEYSVFCRKKGSLDAEEEILVDNNKRAEGYEFYRSSDNVSPNHNLLLIMTDTVGRRNYSIEVKNLTTGEMLPDVIANTSGNVVWANDNRTIFYSKKDEVTLRTYQIYRHTLGNDPATDVLVYQEDDAKYQCFISKTKSDAFLVMGSYSTLATEIHVLSADDPMGDFTVLQPRREDHLYYVSHVDDHFYLRTNRVRASNFMLMKTHEDALAEENWETVIEHREDVLLSGITTFNDYMVLSERKNGLTQLRIMKWNGEDDHYLDFGESAYVASVGTNVEANTTALRYSYQSLTTPSSTYEYNMETKEQTLLKETPVLGGFSRENYTTDRLWATAADGTQVPITIVYRTDQLEQGKNPLLVSGYGSYGFSRDPYFRKNVFSLLDRGFVYAMAHIRGGQELGRHWYEDGKLFNKKNTFTDFNDCTEFLLKEGYGDPKRVFAQGGSAGGLLMGAIMNMRPDLYKGIIANVPFVDVITTMLDESIPLTTGEFDEWGNPKDKEYYDYMLSYSPYDNVEAKKYPNMLVTTGLHDSQVQYWEPAKWVAKLRELKTDENILMLKTNMDAGHGGASGRFNSYYEVALEYAFLLDLAGIQD
ncbi:MAG: S9 family peptidase [Bacteroidota bacterium]